MLRRYTALRRRIVLIMAAAATIPLIILASINYFEFRNAFTRETEAPFRSVVAKTKNSFELFLTERSSTVSLVASLYSYEELADREQMQKIFSAMQKEFSGFVDIALISLEGRLINYVGPLSKELEGADYSGQEWFQQMRAGENFVSEVFEGLRHAPHMIIAVRHGSPDGRSWIVRATLDTSQFIKIISVMNFESSNDAFLVNRQGVLQTDSLYFGNALSSLPFAMPLPQFDGSVMEIEDKQGGRLLLSYSHIAGSSFVLMAVKPAYSFLQAWLLVRTDLLLIFLFSVLCIYFVAARSVEQLIERLRKSDREREEALLQMEHSHKLSSIGRLAAGVAHEINNPLAVINEKAGLLNDILELEEDFPQRGQFETQLNAISAAVTRCRDITHRMLGFARRMDIRIEQLNINEMIRETLTFLETEAQLRHVDVMLELDDNLPGIMCDRGQVQQVFLNVLNNALDAVPEGGWVKIHSALRDPGTMAVSFTDNGCGMSEETRKHIFEPFFTTKSEHGTGLGLSIIYGIIKRHNGNIEVESQLGKGSTVTIVLPVRQVCTGETA